MVSSPESTPLTKRLVHAVATVLPEAYDRSCNVPPGVGVCSSPEDWLIEAQAAVAAVLRELASCRDNPPFPAPPVHWAYFTSGELSRLADSIEKGEAGDGPQ